jgi:hypothetical protein
LPELGFGGRGLGRYFVLSLHPIATTNEAKAVKAVTIGWLFLAVAPVSRTIARVSMKAWHSSNFLLIAMTTIAAEWDMKIRRSRAQ